MDTTRWSGSLPSPGATGRSGWWAAPTARPVSGSPPPAQPPHLQAICPVVTGSNFFRGWVYQGGAFQLGFNLFWNWMMSSRRSRGGPKAEELFRHRPLRTVPLPDPEVEPLLLRLAGPPDRGRLLARVLGQRAATPGSRCRPSTLAAGTTSSSVERSRTSSACAARAGRKRHAPGSGCSSAPGRTAPRTASFPITASASTGPTTRSISPGSSCASSTGICAAPERRTISRRSASS